MRCHLRTAGADSINEKCDPGSVEHGNGSGRRDSAAPKSDAIAAKYAASCIGGPERRVHGHSKEHIGPRELRQEMAERTHPDKTYENQDDGGVHGIKSPPGPLRYDAIPAPATRVSLRSPVSGR